MDSRLDVHFQFLILHSPMSQAQLEAGVTFKKSTAKGMPELDFVPVNLHIQQMKVKRGEEDKGELNSLSLSFSLSLSLSLSLSFMCVHTHTHTHTLSYVVLCCVRLL